MRRNRAKARLQRLGGAFISELGNIGKRTDDDDYADWDCPYLLSVRRATSPVQGNVAIISRSDVQA